MRRYLVLDIFLHCLRAYTQEWLCYNEMRNQLKQGVGSEGIMAIKTMQWIMLVSHELHLLYVVYLAVLDEESINTP